jgi:hypothetical protein
MASGLGCHVPGARAARAVGNSAEEKGECLARRHVRPVNGDSGVAVRYALWLSTGPCGDWTAARAGCQARRIRR